VLIAAPLAAGTLTLLVQLACPLYVTGALWVLQLGVVIGTYEPAGELVTGSFALD